jgi:polyisoprenoid-binding protein YceI
MRYSIVAALLLYTAIPGFAQTTWKTDKAHSGVKFTVSHLVIAEVEGRFTDFDATVTTTKDDWSDMAVQATIKTASISTDNERRDNHLRSDDFLNAEKFPELTFKSTKVEASGKDTYRITGDLTIRDITRPVILDATFKGVIKDPSGRTKAGFRATTTIDRFDWGVKWSKAVETGGLVAGKDVTITLLFEFAKQ